MTYIEKILKEFNERFPESDVWEDPTIGYSSPVEKIKLFLAESIRQAVAEEREKIKKEITVIFSGEEKDLQDLLNAPSLKVNK